MSKDATRAPGPTARSKKLLGALGARALLGAPSLTTRSKKLLGVLASLPGARTLLGAPGLTTSEQEATTGSWHRY